MRPGLDSDTTATQRSLASAAARRSLASAATRHSLASAATRRSLASAATRQLTWLRRDTAASRCGLASAMSQQRRMISQGSWLWREPGSSLRRNRNEIEMSPLWATGMIFFSLFLGSDGRALYPLPSKQHKDKKPLQTSRPYNIAHRGSNGEIPEETAAAYMRAIEEGADFIESDILATKDGQLICFHDVTLDATTDIADHSKFAGRKRTYEVEGSNMTGYFVVDFTLAELKSLRVKQRYPFRDQQYNGKFSIITFEEFIAIALDAKRIVGIYPEIKDPVFINQRVKWDNGKKFEDKFVETLQKYGYRGAYMSTEWLKQPVFIQSFAPTSLVYISNLTDSPKVFLIDDFDIRTQDTNQSFWEITSDNYFEYIANFVIGIGPWKDTIVPPKNNYLTTPTDLVDRAHAHNLQVHTYTYRNENSYLHFDFHQDPYAEYDYWINEIGVDGVFTDFTGSLHQYQEWAQASATNEASALGLLHKIALMISSFEGEG